MLGSTEVRNQSSSRCWGGISGEKWGNPLVFENPCCEEAFPRSRKNLSGCLVTIYQRIPRGGTYLLGQLCWDGRVLLQWQSPSVPRYLVLLTRYVHTAIPNLYWNNLQENQHLLSTDSVPCALLHVQLAGITNSKIPRSRCRCFSVSQMERPV